jgi:hypothetical protein
MRVYSVQLEVENDIFQYEVLTNDFDAVDLARLHLSYIIGDEAWTVHMGGYSETGFEADGEPTVHVEVLCFSVK